MLKKLEDLGDINFHNIFYLTQYIKLIIISIWIQYKNAMKFYDHFFFSTKSLHVHVAFTVTLHLNLG